MSYIWYISHQLLTFNMIDHNFIRSHKADRLFSGTTYTMGADD